MSISLRANTESDQEKIGIALSKLAQDDPTFRVRTDAITGLSTLAGLGELHLKLLVERMVLEHKVEVSVGAPQVMYCETIRARAEGEGRYIRQTGGLGNYGHAKIRVEPNERGEGYEFLNEIKGGVIPNEYIESINESIHAAMAGGTLAGYEMVDIKVGVFDGSFHDVDSNEMAFRIAGSLAFKEAVRKANPVLLEPMMAVEVKVPEKYMGALIGDLNARRGRIEGMEKVGGAQMITATVPLSDMIGYPAAAATIAANRADVSMRFLRYEEAPSRWRPEGDDPGIMVRNPRHPRPGSGSSSVKLHIN